MILYGLSVEHLARLLTLDRPGDADSWLLHGPTHDLVEPVEEDEPPMRWAAE